MPKPRKDAKRVTLYLSTVIIEKLELYCKYTGLSKTVAVERFIDQSLKEEEWNLDDTKRDM